MWACFRSPSLTLLDYSLINYTQKKSGDSRLYTFAGNISQLLYYYWFVRTIHFYSSHPLQKREKRCRPFVLQFTYLVPQAAERVLTP